MKQNIFTTLIALTLMFVMPAKSLAQDAIFEKFNDVNGITTVYISKTMLQMIPNVKASNIEVGNVASKLDQLRVLSCERPSMIANVKKQFVDYYKKNQYEIVMQANDDGDHATIYFKKLKAGKSEFALITEEDDEISIINVKGDINLKDIQQITGK